MSADLVPPDLLAIMQCPVCGGPLEASPQQRVLICTRCGHTYPVDEHGIPDMVVATDEE